MYDLQVGQVRGAHAHKVLHQLLISVSGSFDVTLDDGSEKRVVRLDKPWEALHIPPMIWASESNFSSGAVCLVMASDVYTESEYIRDYEQYLRFIELG